MEWKTETHDQTAGFDTAPFIYYIEENPTYFGTVSPFFESVNRGEIQVITSMVTLLEVLVHPFRLTHLFHFRKGFWINEKGHHSLVFGQLANQVQGLATLWNLHRFCFSLIV
ncbi:MAG: hypothetical protein HQM13_10040 [SAR324 cluster bacterium]|nr:hypothetical protein [SAR324 cluster bacterium]